MVAHHLQKHKKIKKICTLTYSEVHVHVKHGDWSQFSSSVAGGSMQETSWYL